jgi:hypothetical protein
MVTYHDYAKDLRALADILDVTTLPLPKYPEQGLSVDIHVASRSDVEQATRTLDAKANYRNGHTTLMVDFETVHLKFIHIAGAAMAAHRVRQDFAATMPAGWPASVLTPSYCPPQVTS